jgi:hypothetical protein
MIRQLSNLFMSGIAALLLISCNGKAPKEPEISTPKNEPVAAEIAPVQLRIYQVSQTEYPEGNYQVFGIYVDNHTRDTITGIEGRLVYCGQAGDTLAFIDFRPKKHGQTIVTLICEGDTLEETEEFNIGPSQDVMETIAFLMKDGQEFSDRMKAMSDRFSCLWFPENGGVTHR